MDLNKILKDQFFVIVNEQLQRNNPPETQLAFNRLLKEGYSEEEAKALIAQCVANEMITSMQTDAPPFQGTRYIENLKNLPDTPV